MNNQFRRFMLIAPVALSMGVGTSLLAETMHQRSRQSAQTEQQQDATTMYPGDNPTDRPVDSTARANPQSFTGTIVKTGGKLVLQEPRSATYQVDDQEAVTPYEGMSVTLYGNLEPKTKLIHLEQQ
jgi:hypothetical protein